VTPICLEIEFHSLSLSPSRSFLLVSLSLERIRHFRRERLSLSLLRPWPGHYADFYGPLYAGGGVEKDKFGGKRHSSLPFSLSLPPSLKKSQARKIAKEKREDLAFKFALSARTSLFLSLSGNAWLYVEYKTRPIRSKTKSAKCQKCPSYNIDFRTSKYI